MNAARWLTMAAIAAAGCAKAPPVPTDNYYRLGEPAVEQALDRALTEGAILVRPLQSDGVHSERALLYTDDDRGISLKRYSYHLWVDPPPRLIQSQLIQYLRAARVAPLVVNELDDEPALLVSGRLKRFEREQRQDKVIAHVALELRLDDNRGRLLLLRDYRAELPVADQSVEGTVNALDAGLNGIFAEFLADAVAALAAGSTAP